MASTGSGDWLRQTGQERGVTRVRVSSVGTTSEWTAASEEWTLLFFKIMCANVRHSAGYKSLRFDCCFLQHKQHPIRGCADPIPGFMSLEYFTFHKD